MSSRRNLWVGVAAVAIVLVVASVAAWRAGRSVAAPPFSSPAADTSPTSMAWWTLEETFRDPATMTGFVLTFGTFDGAHPGSVVKAIGPLMGEQMRGAAPVAAGPIGDEIAVAYWDGQTTFVERVSVSTGQTQRIAQIPQIVTALTMPIAGSLYAALRDPVSRESTEIVRIGMADGRLESIVHLPGIGQATRPPPGIGSDTFVRLVVSTETDSLVVLACEVECEIATYDIDGGSLRWWDSTNLTESAGIESNGVALFRSCEGCVARVFDLMTGTPTEVDDVCGGAELVGGPTAGLVINSVKDGSCGGDAYEVRLASLTDPGAKHLLRSFPDRSHVLAQRDTAAGYETPNGWVVLLGEAGFAKFGTPEGPWYLRVSDGFVLSGGASPAAS